MKTVIFALVALFAAQAFAADEYPRLGTYPIGGDRNYQTPEYTQKLAKMHVVVLGIWDGWENTRIPLEQLIQNIHAINPHTRVTQYVLAESLQIPANPSFAPFEQKVNAENWWLYAKGTSGSKVLSDFGHDTYILNTTTHSRPDSSGKNFTTWFAHYAFDTYAREAPSIAGMYLDNVFWKPRRDGDWNMDGTTDSQNSTTVQNYYRAGNRQYFDEMRKLMPGKIQLGNLADWGQTNAVLTDYDGQLDGGVLEKVIGASYSIENSGWSALMAHYRKTMHALRGEKLGIFEQAGSLTDYQGMRYGLASCLMDDGYYSYNNSANNNGEVPIFDEFSAHLGAATTGPQTSAWQSGVYRRDFTNGIALVNPKGNGERTVTLETDFRKLTGTQAPSINNGATVRSVTLKDRDGIILLRVNAVPAKKPLPPTNITTTPPARRHRR